MRLFGFEIRKQETKPALVTPVTNDGAVNNEISPGTSGAYGYYFDINRKLSNEIDLINKYRSMANTPEIDIAIDDIVNEMINISDDEQPIVANVRSENGDIPEQVVIAIEEEFKNILQLYDFNNQGYDLGKQFYVDGRLIGQYIVDETNLSIGIQEIRLLDPRKIKKMRDITKQKNSGGADVVVDIKEYFVYNDAGINSANTGLTLSPDTIMYATSGLVDDSGMTISWLNKAIKPMNQLRYMEDAALIYTLSRAPSRRVFYIDISDMQKAKAEQYMQSIMTKYKNKVVYDQSSGEIKDSRVHLAMNEDYWLPRRSNGRSTEIQTLPAENITGQIENITYFLNRLYGALNIPASRLRPETGFSLGRTQEITRDEVKFSKFIDRLRKRFNQIFMQPLRVQLILKGIISPEDWNFIQSRITFAYANDNYFAELKESEILDNRLRMVNDISPLVGTYFSRDYVLRKILKMTDDEILEQQKLIASEPKPVVNNEEIKHMEWKTINETRN